ncbi:SDR family oxidoreductase [Sphingomonas sp. CGMCC 1.13654]|uniref:SDR family oxidoreductase n=1 Tax=Sphingomonas chungangi TaxID=2683589 RepID=A0A838LET6_9SPHN|nr:SDR family oxidoreductase [Sphingomonas chungangi]MBA2936636.1 SDR family oxidoreductase [Sphingomonas chungangi]MVW56021.1 SDR family oxidoreductase [Sphingomonas chungangi]
MTTMLTDKTALVTGGSRGIGAAIARRLAREGANVVITYAGNEAAAAETVAAIEAEGRKALAIRADASDMAASRTAVVQAAEFLGGLDILVHNAGVAEFGPVGEIGDGSYRQQFGVNVDGVFAGTSAAIPHLRDGGRVIIIGSVNAHTMPTPGGAIYGATKAAVAGLARGWARDLGPRGILVNVIQPGPVDTDMNPADGDFAKVLVPLMAIGRYGKVEEIANLAAFLASDESSLITGTTIDIDGGFSI